MPFANRRGRFVRSTRRYVSRATLLGIFSPPRQQRHLTLLRSSRLLPPAHVTMASPSPCLSTPGLCASGQPSQRANGRLPPSREPASASKSCYFCGFRCLARALRILPCELANAVAQLARPEITTLQLGRGNLSFAMKRL